MASRVLLQVCGRLDLSRVREQTNDTGEELQGEEEGGGGGDVLALCKLASYFPLFFFFVKYEAYVHEYSIQVDADMLQMW